MALPDYSLSITAREAYGLLGYETEGLLTLDPPYQRGDVWTTEQRVGLIRSLLMGIPVPALIINERYRLFDRVTEDYTGPIYAVIDGKQRLTTLRLWFAGELAVPACWFTEEVAGHAATTDALVTIHDLTPSGRIFTKRKFLLPVAEAKLQTLAEEAQVYGLVNGAGTPQTAQDLERAAAVASRPQ